MTRVWESIHTVEWVHIQGDGAYAQATVRVWWGVAGESEIPDQRELRRRRHEIYEIVRNAPKDMQFAQLAELLVLACPGISAVEVRDTYDGIVLYTEWP